jgi:hypothetical protein
VACGSADLVRLRVNRRDGTAEWTKLLARAVTAEQQAWAATVDDRRQRPRASLLNEAPSVLLDGSWTYTLRKHPVPPRNTSWCCVPHRSP